MKAFKTYFISLISITFLFGCNSGERIEIDGTAEMVAILDSIASNSVPIENYHMNLERARIHQQQMESVQDGRQQTEVFLQWNSELIRGGETEMAINNLEIMKRRIEEQGVQFNQIVQLVYEMLGIAYLRLGEQENCIENHTSASCIVPLAEEGFHSIRRGSENAVEIYQYLLNQDPENKDYRYLYNVAKMTLGKYPDQVPSELLLPLLPDADLVFSEFNEIAIPLGLDVLGLSGGVCIDDFTGNGYMDIFVTSYGLTDQCRFFINNGDGSFSDATLTSGLEGITSGLNAVHADYNNSGYPDILILRGAWLDKGGNHPNSLLRNNGDGTFTDVTIESGLLSFHPTQTAAWADFDGDGYLDLYIGNESNPALQLNHPNQLYRNNGDGTFTEISADLGLNLSVFSKGALWTDINNNGRPDLFISVLGGHNYLFANRGGTSPADWRFEDISQKAGVQFPVFSFPAMAFDYNNDGFEDIFILDYNVRVLENVAGEFVLDLLDMDVSGETMRVLRNNGNETFTDVTKELGLDKVTFAMGLNFGDLNNNGYIDFYLGTGAPSFESIIPNRMFLNNGGEKYKEISYNGFAHIQKGHGIAFADLDNDGDQDVYAVQGGAFEGDLAYNLLFENPGTENNWLHLVLEGTSANRSAIGAQIEVDVVDISGVERTIYRRVNTGATFGANPLRQEIGLGQADRISELRINWPSVEDRKSVFANVPLNSILNITQGESDFEVMNYQPIKLNRPMRHPLAITHCKETNEMLIEE